MSKDPAPIAAAWAPLPLPPLPHTDQALAPQQPPGSTRQRRRAWKSHRACENSGKEPFAVVPLQRHPRRRVFQPSERCSVPVPPRRGLRQQQRSNGCGCFRKTSPGRQGTYAIVVIAFFADLWHASGGCCFVPAKDFTGRGAVFISRKKSQGGESGAAPSPGHGRPVPPAAAPRFPRHLDVPAGSDAGAC